MRKIQCASRDLWTIAKWTIYGVFGGSVGFLVPYLISFNSRQTEIDNIYKDKAPEFDCKAIAERRPWAAYSKGGDGVTAGADIILYCPQVAVADEIVAFAERQVPQLDLFRAYLLFLLVGAIIGAILGVRMVRLRQHSIPLQLAEMKQREEKSNLEELQQEAMALEVKYGQLYGKNPAKPPEFLCEPEFPHTLMTLPPVVCSDGYARGLSRFQRMVEEKTVSQFSGKPLLPRGIVDVILRGNLITFIEGRPLAYEFVHVYPKKKLSVQNSQSLYTIIKNVLKDIRFFLFTPVKFILLPAVFFFLTVYWIGRNVSGGSRLEENKYMLAHAPEFNCSALVSSGFKKVLLDCYDLFTQEVLKDAADRYAASISSNDLSDYTPLVLMSLMVGFGVGGEYVMSDFSKYLYWKENPIPDQTVEEEDDLENPPDEQLISDRHLCQINRAILGKPVVILEDGFCHSGPVLEANIALQQSQGKNSFLSPHRKILPSYPIFWRYVQRENEISQLDIKPGAELRALPKKTK